MADEADIASEIQEADLNIALSNLKRFTGISATHCVECDNPIPEKRRKLLQGIQTCVECAARSTT